MKVSTNLISDHLYSSVASGRVINLETLCSFTFLFLLIDLKIHSTIEVQYFKLLLVASSYKSLGSCHLATSVVIKVLIVNSDCCALARLPVTFLNSCSDIKTSDFGIYSRR